MVICNDVKAIATMYTAEPRAGRNLHRLQVPRRIGAALSGRTPQSGVFLRIYPNTTECHSLFLAVLHATALNDIRRHCLASAAMNAPGVFHR